MQPIRNILQNIFNGAANFPFAAAIGLIIAAFLIYWITGAISEQFAYAKAKREYDAKTNEIQKTIQTALIEAEKAKARSKIAEDKANKIIEANTERAKTQTAKDTALDTQIKETQKEGKLKENEIENNFNNDIQRASNMSDDERAADICSRIERLAANNPALAEYRCNAQN